MTVQQLIDKLKSVNPKAVVFVSHDDGYHPTAHEHSIEPRSFEITRCDCGDETYDLNNDDLATCDRVIL